MKRLSVKSICPESTNGLIAMRYHHLMAVLVILMLILVFVPAVLFAKLCWELLEALLGGKRKTQTHDQDIPHSEDPRFQ